VENQIFKFPWAKNFDTNKLKQINDEIKISKVKHTSSPTSPPTFASLPVRVLRARILVFNRQECAFSSTARSNSLLQKPKEKSSKGKALWNINF
jgi:hypothetical protein